MDRRKILLVVAVVVAVLGAGLVFVYANGAEDRAQDKLQSRYVLVATQDIAVGESVAAASDAGKLISKPVPESELLAGSTNNGDDFADSIALTTIYAGEQLVTQKFGNIDEIANASQLPIPEGDVAITLQLTDSGRVGSFTRPGSHVAIYFQPFVADNTATGDPNQPTLPDNVVQVSPACVIEPDITVVGVGSQAVAQQAPTDGSTAPAQTDTVAVTLLTVAVDSEQASVLRGIQNAADSEGRQLLSFALRNGTSEVENVGLCADYVREFRTSLGLGRGANDSTNG